MSETTKKAALIVIIVAAVIAAGYSAYRFTTSDQPVPSGVDNSIPAGAKTGKQLEMESMQQGKQGPERDASGGG